MGYNLLVNGVYWGCNPLTNSLLSSWDIQVIQLQNFVTLVFWGVYPCSHNHSSMKNGVCPIIATFQPLSTWLWEKEPVLPQSWCRGLQKEVVILGEAILHCMMVFFCLKSSLCRVILGCMNWGWTSPLNSSFQMVLFHFFPTITPQQIAGYGHFEEAKSATWRIILFNKGFNIFSKSPK